MNGLFTVINLVNMIFDIVGGIALFAWFRAFFIGGNDRSNER